MPPPLHILAACLAILSGWAFAGPNERRVERFFREELGCANVIEEQTHMKAAAENGFSVRAEDFDGGKTKGISRIYLAAHAERKLRPLCEHALGGEVVRSEKIDLFNRPVVVISVARVVEVTSSELDLLNRTLGEALDNSR